MVMGVEYLAARLRRLAHRWCPSRKLPTRPQLGWGPDKLTLVINKENRAMLDRGPALSDGV